jgi:hypothetical protein
MAMTSRLWSINALATELDMDRRTVASRLRNVPPDGRLNGNPAWHLPTALEAINGTGKRQPAVRAPEPPPGFGALAAVDNPVEQGMLFWHLWVAYHAQPLSAWAAVEAGADLDTAYRVSRTLPVLYMLEAEKMARASGVSWAGNGKGGGPDIYTLEAFQQVDWDRLKQQTGQLDWTPPAE